MKYCFVVIMLAACGQSDDLQPWGLSGKSEVYGEDGRKDILSPSVSQSIRDLARSVALMTSSSGLMAGAAHSKLALHKLTKKLCEGEPFSDQLAPAEACTAFLVAPDIMVTAGHCLEAIPCDNARFVFDFHSKHVANNHLAGDAWVDAHVRIPSENIYRCKEVIDAAEELLVIRGSEAPDDMTSRPDRQWTRASQSLLRARSDFAVVRLWRAVQKRDPLVVNWHGVPESGVELISIGHPLGAPAHVAMGGQTQFVDEGYDFFFDKERFFVNTLDAIGGQSGSPVLTTDGVVQGIHTHSHVSMVEDIAQKCERLSTPCPYWDQTTFQCGGSLAARPRTFRAALGKIVASQIGPERSWSPSDKPMANDSTCDGCDLSRGMQCVLSPQGAGFQPACTTEQDDCQQGQLRQCIFGPASTPSCAFVQQCSSIGQWGPCLSVDDSTNEVVAALRATFAAEELACSSQSATWTSKPQDVADYVVEIAEGGKRLEGQRLTISGQVCNRGAIAATLETTLRLYLARFNAEVVEDSKVPPLAAAQCHEFSFERSLDPGSYLGAVKADSERQVDEGRGEFNNVHVFKVTVEKEEPAVDPQPTIHVTVASRLIGNGQVEFTIDGCHTQPTFEGFDVALYIDSDLEPACGAAPSDVWRIEVANTCWSKQVTKTIPAGRNVRVWGVADPSCTVFTADMAGRTHSIVVVVPTMPSTGSPTDQEPSSGGQQSPGAQQSPSGGQQSSTQQSPSAGTQGGQPGVPSGDGGCSVSGRPESAGGLLVLWLLAVIRLSRGRPKGEVASAR